MKNKGNYQIVRYNNNKQELLHVHTKLAGAANYIDFVIVTIIIVFLLVNFNN